MLARILDRVRNYPKPVKIIITAFLGLGHASTMAGLRLLTLLKALDKTNINSPTLRIISGTLVVASNANLAVMTRITSIWNALQKKESTLTSNAAINDGAYQPVKVIYIITGIVQFQSSATVATRSLLGTINVKNNYIIIPTSIYMTSSILAGYCAFNLETLTENMLDFLQQLKNFRQTFNPSVRNSLIFAICTMNATANFTSAYFSASRALDSTFEDKYSQQIKIAALLHASFFSLVLFPNSRGQLAKLIEAPKKLNFNLHEASTSTRIMFGLQLSSNAFYLFFFALFNYMTFITLIDDNKLTTNELLANSLAIFIAACTTIIDLGVNILPIIESILPPKKNNEAKFEDLEQLEEVQEAKNETKTISTSSASIFHNTSVANSILIDTIKEEVPQPGK